MKSSFRSALISAAAATLVITTAGLASGDDLVNSLAVNQVGISIQAGQSASVSYAVTSSNAGGDAGCDPGTGDPAVVTFPGLPAGVTANPSQLTFTSCGVSQSVQFSVAAGTAASADNWVEPLVVDSDGTYNIAAAKFKLAVTSASSSGNAAPTVSIPASDPTAGPEGSPLTTGGTFADDGGAANLTITQLSGAGDITVGANGAWTWAFTPDDNFSAQAVTVQAMDQQGLSVTDTFEWTSTNVNPVVDSVSLTAESACSVGATVAYSDAGSADTHTASLSWGDGSTTQVGDFGAGTDLADSPATSSHTYSTNGTFTVSATVTDDDGGVSASMRSPSGFTTKNTPSAIMQPINASPNRSSFKIGSTIPVKITVTGCDLQPVTSLTPKVDLLFGDPTPDYAVNEPVITEVATNGKTMRWDGSQYIYNLSTKNSQFKADGSALTPGTYTVVVTDPSFYRSTSAKALFDIRK